MKQSDNYKQASSTRHLRKIFAERIFYGTVLLFILSVAASFGQDSIPILPNGLPVVGDINGKEQYLAVKLNQGAALQLDIKEIGFDVLVLLVKINGEEVETIGTGNLSLGYDRETLTFVAEQAGTYIIIIGPNPPTKKGRYSFVNNIKEKATVTEINRVKAEQLLKAGQDKITQKESDLREAVIKLSESSVLWKNLGEKYWEALATYYVGRVYYELKEETKALAYLNQALILFQLANSLNGQAFVLNHLGMTYFNLREKQKALDCYRKALSLFEQVGNKFGKAATYTNAAAVHSRYKENNQALEYHEKALPLFEELNRPFEKANTLLGLGQVYGALGDWVKALNYLNESLKIATDINNFAHQARSLYEIGEAYYELRDTEKAFISYNEALKIFKQIQDRRNEALTMQSIGELYSAIGEKALALDYFNQGLNILTDVKDSYIKADLLKTVGVFYSQLNEKTKALEYFEQSLAAFRVNKDYQEEPDLLLFIGNLYLNTKAKEKALSYYKQALAVSKKENDLKKQIDLLLFIGGMYSNLKDKTQAQSFFNQALQLSKGITDENENSVFLNNIALIHSLLDDDRKALGLMNQSLTFIKNYRSAEGMALGVVGELWASLGNRRLAIFFSKLSINEHQSRRDLFKALDSEFQQSYLRSIKDDYAHLAQLLIEDGQLEQSIEVLNLYQDQQFFDFNRNLDKPAQMIALSSIEQEFARRYEIAGENVGASALQLNDLKQQISNRKPTVQETAQLQKLTAELNRAVNEFKVFLSDVEKEFAKPVNKQDVVASSKTLAETQTALNKLNTATKQNTAALYTLIGKTKFYVLCVTPNEIKSYSSPIEIGDFNQKLLQFYALLQSPEYDPRTLGNILYNIILKPVEEDIKKQNIQTLMWLLDGNLRYIPMAALSPDREKYLIENYQNVVFTRTVGERMSEADSPNWTGFGFGSSKAKTVDLLGNNAKISFPELPGVMKELGAIFRTVDNSSGTLKGEVFSDSGFTKDTFYKALQQRRPVVHISSHFLFRPGDSSRSFLLLGDGTALSLSEMKKQVKLFDGVDLLTLSACSTAAALSDNSGREIDGFAELAQRLGAKSVMATLWQVRDLSTARVMRDFYENRQGGKYTKAESLRKAQLDLLYGRKQLTPDLTNDSNKKSDLRSPSLDDIPIDEKYRILFKRDEKNPFAHPYYWSAFVLFGNWR